MPSTRALAGAPSSAREFVLIGRNDRLQFELAELAVQMLPEQIIKDTAAIKGKTRTLL
jgi:hypothetical protein